jgi:DNA-binding NarL/FixJ family response regulator
VIWTAEPDGELVAALAARLVARRGRVLLLEGAAGAGTTTLGAAMARRLHDDGYRVIPVLAEAALRDIPFGAMTAALGGVAGSPSDASPSERLQLLATALAPATARAVILVDDAPQLDEASAGAVRQFVRASGVHCLVSARTGDALPEALEHLDAEGLVERVAMPPLDDRAAAAAVERALGGPVEPESLHALLLRAAGNPLHLRRLVEEAAQLGVRPSPAGLVVPAPELPPRLARELGERIATLDAAGRALAELLALAAPLEPELLPDPRALRELERRGLATRGDDGARLTHPLLGEYLGDVLTDGDGARQRLEAARMLEATGRDELRFRALGLRATTSEPPTTAELSWAAGHANAFDDRAVAIRYARRAIESARAHDEPPPAAALTVLAAALSMSGSLDEADRIFDEALAAASDDDERAEAATLAGFHHAVRRRDPGRAAEIGGRELDRLAEAPARSYLAANLAKWRLMAGQVSTDAGLPLEPAEDAAFSLSPLVLRLTVAIFAGDLVAARAELAEGRPLVDVARGVTRHGRELLDFGEFLVLLLEGRGTEAAAFGERVRVDRFDESAGMWSYGLALAEYHAGRLDDAHRLARDAVEQLEWRDFLGALGAARGVLATTAAALGHRDHAEALLAAHPSDAERFPTAALQLAEARAWLLHADGADDAAAALLAETAASAMEVGYPSFAALTAHLAVRLGRPGPVLAVLRASAERAPSAPLMGMLAEHAVALEHDDPARLLAVAQQLADARMGGAAHDAALQAADAARRAGAASVSRRARALAARIAPGLQPEPLRRDTPAGLDGLSSRELAIARLAADRERNREIADRLGISPRTVENHLANIYRKLGVTGRDGLRALLG